MPDEIAKPSGASFADMFTALNAGEQKCVNNAGEGLEATPGIEPGYTVLQTVA